jgi:hypothetical protein
MDDDDGHDAKVLVMNRPTGSIRDLIASPMAKPAPPSEPPRPAAMPDDVEADYQPPPKKSDPLPRPGDAYRAHARFLNRLASDPKLIHFVSTDFTCQGYCYSDLRRVSWLPAAEPGSGPVLVLRFVEAVVTEVRITGRNLEDLHYWISEGCMPWICERPDGFRVRDDDATVITGIAFQEIER